MSDLGAGVIEQYDISVIKTLRGRGAVILETNQGYKRLMQYNGTYSRLEYINELLEYVSGHGFKNVDLVLRNDNGMLLTNDAAGDKFIITDWFYGNECDVKSRNNVREGAAVLAAFHNITCDGIMRGDDTVKPIPQTANLLKEYEKHNQELKRTKGFIRSRRHKSEFEYNVLAHIEEYLGYGIEASGQMRASGYEQLESEAVGRGSICHGNYNYHNIIFAKNKVAVVNFDKSGSGIQIKDFYLFFRKVMEKHEWDIAFGHEIIQSYNRVRSISLQEYDIFKIMIMYPEKFWKLVNHYYNSSKSWIPDKNLEKLRTVCHQQMKKEEFVRSM